MIEPLKNPKTDSLRDLLKGQDFGFDKSMEAGKVQLMRLKNIAITIDGQAHKDKNLFDLFLDHQDDGLFDDYVREHTPINAKLLMQADYVIAFVADGKYSRFAGVYQVLGEDKRIQVPTEDKKTFEEKSKGFKEVAPEKMEKNIEKGNYCKRYFEDKNWYIYVSYIEDSVLYIEGLPEDKEEIEAFVSTLKY